MISFSMRALLPVSFLIALGSGCAHRNKPAAAASPSPTTSAPSSTVTSEDIAKAPGQSIEQVLMGRFPGVDVSRTADGGFAVRDRKSTRLNSSHLVISYAVFCLKKKKNMRIVSRMQVQ